MMEETKLREGIQQLEQSSGASDRINSARDQLMTVLSRKTELLKKIACIEADIVKKEKELKSRRR